MKASLYSQQLASKIAVSAFFQRSTRTQLSFEAALLRLGAQCVSFTDVAHDPQGYRREEPLEDVARVLSGYGDVIILRHPNVRALETFRRAATIPIINAGNGIGLGAEHPTQALLDLYTIRSCIGRLTRLKIGIVGEVHQRTARSLISALAKFSGNEVYLHAPDPYTLARSDVDSHVGLYFLHSIEEVVDVCDVIYQCGMRANPENYDPSNFTIKARHFREKKPLLMSPLPRAYDEIERDVDQLPNAVYFDQSHNGVWVRMAVLSWLFGTGSEHVL